MGQCDLFLEDGRGAETKKLFKEQGLVRIGDEPNNTLYYKEDKEQTTKIEGTNPNTLLISIERELNNNRIFI